MGGIHVPTKVYKVPIMEIFGPTIQGEGILLGQPTNFLRTGGCGYRCTWCDSMFAVDPKQVKAGRTMMTMDDIIESLNSLPKSPWLTLTGGDPCMHKGLNGFFPWCWNNEIRICVETQGEFWPEWLKEVDVATFSPKGPSSGNITPITEFRAHLQEYAKASNARIAVKVVVFDEADLDYAKRLLDEITFHARMYDKFYFQVGSPLTAEVPHFEIQVTDEHPETEEEIRAWMTVDWKRKVILERYLWLTESLLQEVESLNYNVGVTPQMHTLLWPTEDRGR